MRDEVEFTGWRKSSRSFANGNFAEVAAWRKATASMSNGHCAEVGTCPSGIGVRDTMDRGGPVLVFGGRAWTAFLSSLRSEQSP